MAGEDYFHRDDSLGKAFLKVILELKTVNDLEFSWIF